LGVAVGIIVFVLSASLLLRAVLSFRRAWAAAEILRAPALSHQVLRFAVAGPMSLFLEGPRFHTWGQHCHYTCVDAATSAPVPIAPCYTGAGVRSRRYSRVQHGSLDLPHPGAFVLDVEGVPSVDGSEFSVVFMRPFLGRLIRFILTCVFLGMLLVGSVVLAILAAAL
jgi:hypothetical protein